MNGQKLFQTPHGGVLITLVCDYIDAHGFWWPKWCEILFA